MKSETFLIDSGDNMLCSLPQTEFNLQCGEVDVDSWKQNDSEFNQYWNINSPKWNGFDCFTLKDRSEEIIPFVDLRIGMFEHLGKKTITDVFNAYRMNVSYLILNLLSN